MRFAPIATVARMQAERERMAGTVGLVPTMGFLHEGHLSLVRRALADCDHVVVSIFVNPTQFGPSEDFERYPRDQHRDLDLLRAILDSPLPHTGEGLGVRDPLHAIFIPAVDEMYPPGFDDWVEVKGPLTERLESAHRPGHFRGVTTVVARLFRIVRPHRAYFGQKDAQQLRVIRRMVQDTVRPEEPRRSLASDRRGVSKDRVEIVAMPIVREPDGLAMSSRNVYLSPEERHTAIALPRALSLARRLVMDEGLTNADTIRNALRDLLSQGVRLSIRSRLGRESPSATSLPVGGGTESQPDGRAAESPLIVDYVSLSDEQTFEELDTIDRPALVLLAARVGTTRLIDNTIVVPKGMPVADGLRELVEADTAALHRTPDC